MHGAVFLFLACVLPFVMGPLVRAEEVFRAGELWLDDHGVHVNAHGGGVLHHEGVYYWFGEHKTEGRRGNRANVGVRCYASRDLRHWTDEGVALAVVDDPTSDITRGCVLERPKVIFNPRTGQFVMWFHLELRGQGYSAARTGVAVADRATGPYRFLRSGRVNAGVWPEGYEPRGREVGEGVVETKDAADDSVLRRDFAGGQMARDMTLFVDDDGKAYHLHASEENRTLHLCELSDDYLTFTGRYRRLFPGRYHEAPALFQRGGRYYLITSGCTGWEPNAARSAVADSIWGPWTELGNPCEGVNAKTGLGPEKTFGGQSTYVLAVAGEPDRFIAMFDEWRPQNAIDGRYYWLPIEFTEGGFRVRWRDAWGLEDERR